MKGHISIEVKLCIKEEKKQKILEVLNGLFIKDKLNRLKIKLSLEEGEGIVVMKFDASIKALPLIADVIDITLHYLSREIRQ